MSTLITEISIGDIWREKSTNRIWFVSNKDWIRMVGQLNISPPGAYLEPYDILIGMSSVKIIAFLWNVGWTLWWTALTVFAYREEQFFWTVWCSLFSLFSASFLFYAPPPQQKQ